MPSQMVPVLGAWLPLRIKRPLQARPEHLWLASTERLEELVILLWSLDALIQMLTLSRRPQPGSSSPSVSTQLTVNHDAQVGSDRGRPTPNRHDGKCSHGRTAVGRL